MYTPIYKYTKLEIRKKIKTLLIVVFRYLSEVEDRPSFTGLVLFTVFKQRENISDGISSMNSVDTFLSTFCIFVFTGVVFSQKLN